MPRRHKGPAWLVDRCTCPACGAVLQLVVCKDSRTERERWTDAGTAALLREAEAGAKQDEAGW